METLNTSLSQILDNAVYRDGGETKITFYGIGFYLNEHDKARHEYSHDWHELAILDENDAKDAYKKLVASVAGDCQWTVTDDLSNDFDEIVTLTKYEQNAEGCIISCEDVDSTITYAGRWKDGELL